MSFKDLIGNDRIKHILASYIRHEIIPYSMIFTGPHPADLLDFALAFVKAVNCLTHKDDFCGECQNCREIDRSMFMDLKVLEPDGQFYKKEQISFLIEDNRRRPIKGEKKVNLLTEAHRMNENSANAFLKVLEEPAPDNIFILLTTNLSGLLPTIRSRCQILKFSPLPRAEIEKYLLAQGQEPARAFLLSHLCQSNIGGILSEDFDELMERRVKVLADLTSLLSGKGVEDILLDLSARSRSREQFIDYFRRLVNLISLLLRDIMILKIDRDNPNIINIDYKNTLMTLGESIGIEKLLFLIRKMEYLLRDIQRNLNTKVLIIEFIKSYQVKEVSDV